MGAGVLLCAGVAPGRRVTKPDSRWHPSVNLALAVQGFGRDLASAAQLLDDPTPEDALGSGRVSRKVVIGAAFRYILALEHIVEELRGHAERWKRESLPEEIPVGLERDFDPPPRKLGGIL